MKIFYLVVNILKSARFQLKNRDAQALLDLAREIPISNSSLVSRLVKNGQKTWDVINGCALVFQLKGNP